MGVTAWTGVAATGGATVAGGASGSAITKLGTGMPLNTGAGGMTNAPAAMDADAQASKAAAAMDWANLVMMLLRSVALTTRTEAKCSSKNV